MTDSSPAARRTLVLLRHAKSEWPDVSDHERPLAPRGQRDAPEVGRWLRAAGHLPDHVLCSSARRTQETWQLVHEQFGVGVDPRVTVEDRVYQATPGRLLDLIHHVEPDCRTLLVVGHDPAVPSLARALPDTDAAGAAPLLDRLKEKYPTAAVTVLQFEGGWDRLEPGTASLVSFVTPHDLAASLDRDTP